MTRTGTQRHKFSQLVAVHASGAVVEACRCTVELLRHAGQPRLYRTSPGNAWTRHCPDHAEPPEAVEVVVGSTPGHYPAEAPTARWGGH